MVAHPALPQHHDGLGRRHPMPLEDLVGEDAVDEPADACSHHDRGCSDTGGSTWLALLGTHECSSSLETVTSAPLLALSVNRPTATAATAVTP